VKVTDAWEVNYNFGFREASEAREPYQSTQHLREAYRHNSHVKEARVQRPPEGSLPEQRVRYRRGLLHAITTAGAHLRAVDNTLPGVVKITLNIAQK
jgi:hypothetical protein